MDSTLTIFRKFFSGNEKKTYETVTKRTQLKTPKNPEKKNPIKMLLIT